MYKMGSHDPFEYIYKTSNGQKKGRESKCQFDSQSLKVKNHPKLRTCKRCATYCWKTLNKGYKFVLNIISIGKNWHYLLINNF